MKKILTVIFCFLIGAGDLSVFAAADDKLKNFKGTSQKLAFPGVFNEYVEKSIEEILVEDLRANFRKYSRSASDDEMAQYDAGSNDRNQYFKPVDVLGMSEEQKEHLKAISEANSVDIFVLGSTRESSEGIEVQLQLYDARIDTLSRVEEADVNLQKRKKTLEKLVHDLMNYLDRDGFVHPSPQDFLAPLVVGNQLPQAFVPPDEEEFSLNPGALGGGTLAGSATIGGEKTPFWERWWFWTIIGGTLITAGGLSYYFLVVDQPPNKANLEFEFTTVAN